jgi:hypothetical protein
MQRLIMTAAAAAMLSGVVMAATSAKAEYNYGPLKNGTQCYKMSANGWNNQGWLLGVLPRPSRGTGGASEPHRPSSRDPSIQAIVSLDQAGIQG